MIELKNHLNAVKHVSDFLNNEDPKKLNARNKKRGRS